MNGVGKPNTPRIPTDTELPLEGLPSNLPTVASPELRAATESEALELLFCGKLWAFGSDLFRRIWGCSDQKEE